MKSHEAADRRLNLKGRFTVGFITLVGTGLGVATGLDMDSDRRATIERDKRRYERKLDVVKRRVASGDGRLVRLASLTATERADLGVTAPKLVPAEDLNPKLDAIIRPKTIDATVTLPSSKALERAINHKEQEASDKDVITVGMTTFIFGGLAFGVGMGIAQGRAGRRLSTQPLKTSST